MTIDLEKSLTDLLGNRVRFGLDMSRITSWGVGGPLRCLCRVVSVSEVAAVIELANRAGVPWMPLGRGSNLLVSDRGYTGIMLRLAGPLALSRVKGDRLIAGGGAALSATVKLAASLGLAGMEWAVGIPATVGGAVANNAGAMGCEMSDLTEKITLFLPGGDVRSFPGRELASGYRRRMLPRCSLVLETSLRLEKDDPAMIQRRMSRILQRRRGSQPQGARTAGSVFKNPPGDYAGRLIEAAGCKGLSVGGAMVSIHHANFIENRGGATADNVLALMEEIEKRVKEKTGICLEPEVEVVGGL